MVCGGLGDRVKGITPLLYAAIGSHRLFHLDWEKPVHLSQYFKINDKWYHVNGSTYDRVRTISRADNSKRKWEWLVDYNEKDRLLKDLADPNFVKNHSQWNSYDLTANRLMALESIFSNPSMTSEMRTIFPGLESRVDKHDLDYFLIGSAGIRSLLAKPQEKLTNLMDQFLTLNDFNPEIFGDENILKIGVQIRSLRSLWDESDQSRVDSSHVTCFSEKVGQLVENYAQKRRVAIFLTGDNENSTMIFRESLKNKGNIRILETNQYKTELNISLLHLDRSDVSKDPTEAWNEMAQVYLDWLMLRRMDFLLISRSGFGETASLYSLKPTWRFKHDQINANNRCPFFKYGDPDERFDF